MSRHTQILQIYQIYPRIGNIFKAEYPVLQIFNLNLVKYIKKSEKIEELLIIYFLIIFPVSAQTKFCLQTELNYYGQLRFTFVIRRSIFQFTFTIRVN